MNDNPVSKPFCKGCKFWEPIGFYGWERKMDPETNKCKHLKRCGRVWRTAKDYRRD